MIEQDANLQALVEEFFANEFATDNALITQAVKRMLAAGGKRLRPRITLLAAEANGAHSFDHLHLAAYMELIHVATLIHDDVVDRAVTRRGVNATAVDYGNRISVLAGDYLFAWIFKNVTARYPHPIPQILSATLAEICDGEVLQLRALGNLALPLEAYVEIVEKKTASLFAASAECGAIVAGAGPAGVQALRTFGRFYGVAFQMNDDLLDLTADEDTLGKPVGNDLAERKMTIPLILALGRAGGETKRMLARFYDGGEGISTAAVIEAIRENGGLRATQAHVAEYVARAKRSLAALEDSAAKAQLCGLADALLEERS